MIHYPGNIIQKCKSDLFISSPLHKLSLQSKCLNNFYLSIICNTCTFYVSITIYIYYISRYTGLLQQQHQQQQQSIVIPYLTIALNVYYSTFNNVLIMWNKQSNPVKWTK